MKLFRSIKVWWTNRQKKIVINNAVKNTNISNEKKEMLKNAIFNSSKIVKNEIIEKTEKISAYEDEQLYTDLKKVIRKHFGNVLDECVKENEKIKRELKLKNDELNRLKEKVTETLLN